ncbi:MAG: FCD domain-containing protein [Hyphomicrobium sp.]
MNVAESILEPEIVRLATIYMSVRDLTKLGQQLNQLESIVTDAGEFADLEKQFMMTICEGTHNSLILAIYRIMHEVRPAAAVVGQQEAHADAAAHPRGPARPAFPLHRAGAARRRYRRRVHAALHLQHPGGHDLRVSLVAPATPLRGAGRRRRAARLEVPATPLRGAGPPARRSEARGRALRCAEPAAGAEQRG